MGGGIGGGGGSPLQPGPGASYAQPPVIAAPNVSMPMNPQGASAIMQGMTPQMPQGPSMADAANAIGQQAATSGAMPRQPSTFSRYAQKAGQIATAIQPLMNALPGQQGRTQQQQQRYPVNFNASPAPYIPPPGAGSNNNYGY